MFWSSIHFLIAIFENAGSKSKETYCVFRTEHHLIYKKSVKNFDSWGINFHTWKSDDSYKLWI